MRENSRSGPAGGAASSGFPGMGWNILRNTINVFRRRKFLVLASFLIIFLISRFMTVRLSEDEEAIGADIMEHGEPSYII